MRSGMRTHMGGRLANFDARAVLSTRIIGGEERHVRDLAALLAKRGHFVGVATLWREGLPEREVDQGVPIFRMQGLTQRWRGLFVDATRTHAPPFPDPGLVASLRRIIGL